MKKTNGTHSTVLMKAKRHGFKGDSRMSLGGDRVEPGPTSEAKKAWPDDWFQEAA